jgi:hypothetical protein
MSHFVVGQLVSDFAKDCSIFIISKIKRIFAGLPDPEDEGICDLELLTHKSQILHLENYWYNYYFFSSP